MRKSYRKQKQLWKWSPRPEKSTESSFLCHQHAKDLEMLNYQLIKYPNCGINVIFSLLAVFWDLTVKNLERDFGKTFGQYSKSHPEQFKIYFMPGISK